MITLSVQDEQVAGKVVNTLEVHLPKTRCTVSAIIAARVSTEVAVWNTQATVSAYALIQPIDNSSQLDTEQQIYLALSAFHRKAYKVLVDRIAASSLDQIVELTQDTRISFVQQQDNILTDPPTGR